MLRNNSGYVKSTKFGVPWELKYFEPYTTREAALSREYQIKKKEEPGLFREINIGCW